MLEAIEAVIGDRPFSYLGESFVGSHVGIYLAAKRPEKVWPRRLELKISASADHCPIDFASAAAGQINHPPLPVLATRVRRVFSSSLTFCADR
jgi:hypothetical protein